MNQNTRRIVVFSVTLALCIIALGVLARKGTPTSSPQSPPLFPDFGARGNAATSVTLRAGDVTTRLVRTDDGRWVVATTHNYPADEGKVRDALRALADARIVETKTAKTDLHARLHVEDPASPGAKSVLLTVSGADGAPIASLVIGKTDTAASDSPRCFVRKPEAPQAWLATGAFPTNPAVLSWINPDIGSLPNEAVRSVTLLQGQDGERLHVHRTTPAEQTFTLDGKPEGRELKDQFVLTRLAWAMAFMTLEDVAPAKDIDTTVEGATIAEFRCFDGLLVRVRLVQRDGKAWASFRAEFEAPAPAEGAVATTAPDTAMTGRIAELNASWGPWVFQIPAFKAEVLASTMESLLKPVAPPAPLPGEPEPGPRGQQ